MKKIFEPIKINQLQLKNRMVVSAMVTNYCNADGTASEKFIAYHEKKAKGGWGLIITEDYTINSTAGGFVCLPGLWKDEQIESHRKLTERIHNAGGKIAAQIYHAGRETCSAITGEQPIGPTALKDPTMPEIPRELTVSEIHELVEQFGDAAYRARQAGFDAVEVHGAHGYLVGAFMSLFSNKRTDQYGGTIENRARFAVEIIENIRLKCGNDFPILYRISAVEYVHGGLDIEESKVIARILEKAGVDCIHCSQGVYGSVHTVIPPSVFPRAGYVDNAAALKSVVDIPVIAVGRINDPEIAETVIRSGKADLVTMARASLADPDLPNKAAAGKSDDILRCIGCLQGCIGENGKGSGVRCLVNPMTGMEDEYKFVMAEKSKNVVIVGGGVSGCEAALVAAKRGHKVTLIEKSSRIGGQWIAATVPIGKGGFSSFVHWQNLQLKKYNVNVIYNVEADKKAIEAFEPDAVIIATGSNPIKPPIKGINQENVVTAHEVLLGQVTVGEKVVVIGGGLVGAETADLLAGHGSKVTIIEMMPQIIKDGEPIPAKYMKERFKENEVEIYVSTAVKSIEGNQVFVENNGQTSTIDNVDTVVVAVGVKSDKTLLNSLENSSYEVIAVGDADQVKNGYLGIREGYEVGLKL